MCAVVLGVDFVFPAYVAVFTALVTGPFVLVFSRRIRRRIEALGDTTVVGCDVGTVADGSGVWVRGVAAPSPQGSVRAPLLGEDCVWFATRTTTLGTPLFGPAYGTPLFGPVRSPQLMATPKLFSRPTWQQSSVPFALRDESGQIAVSPDGLTLSDNPQSSFDTVPDDRMVKTVDYVEKDRRFRNRRLRKRGVGGWRHEEWILPAGSEVYVRGALNRVISGPVLSRPSSGGFLLTLAPPEAERRNNKQALWVFKWLLVPACSVFAYVMMVVFQLVGWLSF